MAITHDFVTLHSCDTTEGITVIGDGAISVNTSIYKEGTGALNLYKPYTTQTSFGIELSFTSALNFRNKLVAFWVYVKRGVIEKLDKIRISYIDSSNNIGYRDISPSILNVDGWKSILYLMNRRWQGGWYLTDPPFGDLSGYSPSYPNDTAIAKIRIEFFTKSASDTIAEGELVIDWIRYGKTITVMEGVVGDFFTRVAEYDRENNLGLADYGNGSIIFKGVSITIGDGSTSYTVSSYGESVIYITPCESDTFLYVRRYSKLVIGRQASGKVGKDGSSLHAYGYPYLIYFIVGESNIDSIVEIWQCSINHFNIRGASNAYAIGYLNAQIYNTVILNAMGVIFRCRYNAYNVQFLNSDYGIWGGTAVSIEDVYANGGAVPVTFEYNQVATVYRVVSRNTLYLARLLSFNGTCTLVDVDADTLNRYWDGAASSNTGTLNLAYTFTPRILDAQGNPLAGVLVRLIDRFGNIAYQNTTDVNGRAPAGIVTVTKWTGIQQTGVNKDAETAYNPFTLEIYRDGYKIYRAQVTINRRYDMDIPIAYAVSPKASVGKAFYSVGEPATIYGEFLDASGMRITGLSVNAEVTKPDGSKVTISLKDDGEPPDEVAGDGVYTGQFTATDLVGTYHVEVSTTIYGNPVNARTSFDVGILERLENLIRKHDAKMTALKFA